LVFNYIWEVYKAAVQIKWDYSVLPIFYGVPLVARVASRLVKGIWTISRWWWEPDITPGADLLDALRTAVEDFLHYLRAEEVYIGDEVDARINQSISLLHLRNAV